MSEIAISYGTYYHYLRPKNRRDLRNNHEAEITIFADDEVGADFPDSIRGKHVFIFGDANKYLQELIMTVDAARRASACEITVVCPIMNYSRQDKKGTKRSSLGASVIAKVLQSLGVNRMLSIDLHAEQVMLGYQIPFEHITGKHIFHDIILSKIAEYPEDEWILCSPDAGGTTRVQSFGDMLYLPYVIMSKRRDKPNSVGSMTLIGEVKGKRVIVIDDMVDTGGTLIKANEYLYAEGAVDVLNVITHPILSKGAANKLNTAGIKLITSNTRNTVKDKNTYANFDVVDCSDFLHQAIYNIADNKSILTTLSQ